MCVCVCVCVGDGAVKWWDGMVDGGWWLVVAETRLSLEGGQEVEDDLAELGVGLLAQLTLGTDHAEQVLLRCSQMLQELGLELGDLARLHLVQETAHTRVDDAHLLLNRQRHCKQQEQQN